jgi:cytidylate kinase
MSVVTISRELGSLGSLVAEGAAHTLGYCLADKTTIETILKDYGLVQFTREYDSIPGFWERFDAQKREERQHHINMLNQCICALAHHGNVVIVGRGGFAVLADLDDVLHVRIKAPTPVRVRRLVEAPDIADPGLAELAVMKNDHLQKQFIKTVYGREWDTAKAFDLIIDTGKIPPGLAAEMIVQAARGLKSAATGGRHTSMGLPVDKALCEVVAEVLKSPATHAQSPVRTG